MISLPELSDPRYLREVGWFLHHEKYGPMGMGSTFDEERRLFSQSLLEVLLHLGGYDGEWLKDKTVVSIGCGCTGDLATWPAAVKIGLDPLVYVYQKLGMLVQDAPGTSQTVYLAVGIEDTPLLDGCADLVICRNALDHMLHPEIAAQQISRILKDNGTLYLAVDIGGKPTPDEPTVFSPQRLLALLEPHFQVVVHTDKHQPYSEREYSVRILARKTPAPTSGLDKETLLQAYLAQLAEDERPAPQAVIAQ